MSTGDTPERTSIAPSDLVGRSIADRYELRGLVSTGSNTSIYDATDVDNGRTVTLKLLRPAITASPSFREHFDEQMRAVAALSHPNIVALYDWGMAPVGDTSTAFIVTESLTGGSLRDLFDRGRRLTPSQALVVGLDVCRGLDHGHRRGFVHTELTPSKLVFGDDRRVRIADFGLARLLNAKAWTRPESVPNDLAWYAAPEQGAGSKLDGRTDVYALALILHEAVTGSVPFKTESTVATLAARVGKLMPVSADLGPLAAVLEHAGRPELSERSTAAQFGKDLVAAASNLPRPEPLPLLSSGLFETPADQLRNPDDPTGGVTRPSAPVVVVPATPDPPAADHAPATDAAAPAAADHAPATDAAAPAAADPAPAADHAPATDAAAPATDAAALAAEDHDDAVLADDDESDQGGAAVVVTAAALAAGGVAAGGAAAGAAASDDGVDAGERLGSVTGGSELVILPVDSELDGGPDAVLPEPVPVPRPGVGEADANDLPATTPIPVAPVAVASAGSPERRGRGGLITRILLVLLLVGALVVLGVLASRILRTPEYVVPDLVGTPEAEARNLVAANDWDIVVERERSDEVPVVGQVVRTAPSAGVLLAEGEPFLIVVSEGPTLRELPDSTGVPLSDAQAQLTALGLQVDIVEAYDEVVPLGTVISWSAPADPTLTTGSMVLPETLVQLVVSQGPRPRSVPNVIGMTKADAAATLDGIALVYAESGAEFSDDFPIDTVISQAPAEGTEVNRGDTVSVVISKGVDLVAYPDISGAATYVDAETILREAGFEVTLANGDRESPVTAVRINGEEPTVGQQFRRGTLVEIDAFAPS